MRSGLSTTTLMGMRAVSGARADAGAGAGAGAVAAGALSTDTG